MPEHNEFGRWLRNQLSRRGWSQAELSRRVGVSTGRVSEWANGRFVPDPKSIDKIADALFVDVDEVLAIAGHRPRLPMDELERWHAVIDPYLRRIPLSARNRLDLVSDLERIIRMQELEAGVRTPEQYHDPIELDDEEE